MAVDSHWKSEVNELQFLTLAVDIIFISALAGKSNVLMQLGVRQKLKTWPLNLPRDEVFLTLTYRCNVKTSHNSY